MKNIKGLVLAAVIVAAVSSCAKEDELREQTGPLPAPDVIVTELGRTGFTVSWDAVTDAGGYAYSFNAGEEQTTRNTSLVFSDLEPSASYVFTVKTVPGSNGSYSESELVTVRVTTEEVGTLDAPEPELVAAYRSKTIIKWKAVYGADSYEYSVGGFSGKTSSTTVEINGLEASASYTFRIKALSADKNLNESADGVLTFTTRPEDEDIPQIIMALVETGSDYSKINVYAVADFRYLHFAVPATYFKVKSDNEIRDFYLAALLKAIEEAGMDVSTYISQYAGCGTASYTETPLLSEMSYSVVAFGVNTDGRATTPLYKIETKTLADDAAPFPDTVGEPWFSQSLFHYDFGAYNASNSLWLKWKGENVTGIKSILTSTRSFRTYFELSTDLFREYVKANGTESGQSVIAGVNSENGWTSRYALSSATSYTLGTLAVNADNDTTFVISSMPTKASDRYYDWAGVLLGTDGSATASSSLTGIFQLRVDDSEPVSFRINNLRYFFCRQDELSGVTTDRAAEIVAAKGTDFTQADLDILNLTGKFTLSFGTEGSPLAPDTAYALLATFTERNGDEVTRFSLAKTAAASGTAATKAVFGEPEARIEFGSPVILENFAPLENGRF